MSPKENPARSDARPDSGTPGFGARGSFHPVQGAVPHRTAPILPCPPCAARGRLLPAPCSRPVIDGRALPARSWPPRWLSRHCHSDTPVPRSLGPKVWFSGSRPRTRIRCRQPPTPGKAIPSSRSGGISVRGATTSPRLPEGQDRGASPAEHPRRRSGFPERNCCKRPGSRGSTRENNRSISSS